MYRFLTAALLIATATPSAAQVIRDAFVHVYSTDAKKVIRIKLRSADFQTVCHNDYGTSHWQNPKFGEIIFTCTHREYSSVYSFKYFNPSKVQLVRRVINGPDGSFTATAGELYADALYIRRSLPAEDAGGSYVSLSGDVLSNRDKMYSSEVNYRDAQGRLINSGMRIYAFGDYCGRQNGKFAVLELSDTLVFTCTKNKDWSTFTFKDIGHLIILEGISTNADEKLRPDQIEQIVTSIRR